MQEQTQMQSIYEFMFLWTGWENIVFIVTYVTHSIVAPTYIALVTECMLVCTQNT